MWQIPITFALLFQLGSVSPFQMIASNASYGSRRPHGYGLYDAAVNKTFVCWNGPSMNIYAKAFDHSAQEWSADQLVATQSFTGSWIYHNYPNIAQAPDGRLIIAWAAHTGYMNFARSAQPHDPSGTWETSVVSRDYNAYPMIFTVDDTIYIFYSVDNKDSAVPYRSFGYIKSTDNGDTWTPHAAAIDSEKLDPGAFDEVFACHFHVVSEIGAQPARVQFTWMMRGGPNGHNIGERNAYFASFFPATATWSGADGVDLGDWIDLSEMLAHCLVWDTGPVDTGYPIGKILSSHFADGTPLAISDLDGTQQAMWTGSQWQIDTISPLDAMGLRRMPDGRQRLLLTPPSQPSMTILQLGEKGGEWQSTFEESIPYENGADRSWSMGFIDDGQADVDVMISQINVDQAKTNYTGIWPVWTVNTDDRN